MHQYKNLTLIGTSHIAKESIDIVKSAISDLKPEIIALELDRIRFNVLMGTQKQKKNLLRSVKELGIKGFLFNAIGAYIEKRLGEVVNVKPGSEMKAAILAARPIKADIALIDQDIRITLKNFSRTFTFREKIRLANELLFSIFKRNAISIDLTKVPEKKLIKKMTDKVKKEYPSLYKVLIHDRNTVMANNLMGLMATNKKILVIVGAGHEEGIMEIIKKV